MVNCFDYGAYVSGANPVLRAARRLAGASLSFSAQYLNVLNNSYDRMYM